MELLVAIGVGAFVSKWRDSLLISAAVAAVAVLYNFRKVAGQEAAYAVGYLGGVFVMVIVLAVVAHGLRRLLLSAMRSDAAK